ncbi:MAG TPA: GGDEF domain-containing protein [Solimonas sp.]|nr:GGDEF domain-containing protein [Solimonas sp.]
MTDGASREDGDFASYYRREMRWATVALFSFGALNYALAPTYRSGLLGMPEQAPPGIWAIEWGVIITACVVVAAVRWRWSERVLAYYVTMAATAALAAGIIASRYLWVRAGVPFFNELLGYLLIAVMATGGIEMRRMCLVALPALAVDVAVSYALHGWGPVANFEMLSDLTAGQIAVFTGWFCERNMRRVWTETSALARLARQDELTALLNRRGFEDRAQETLRQAARDRKPVSVALVDLDFFKPFNDRYGHPAGDAALCAVARVLAEHARRPLDLVARFGGEEFVILWFDTGAEGLEQRSGELIEAVRDLCIPHDGTSAAGCLTISLGAVSDTPQYQHRVGRLIERADQRLYQAKQEGRNRAVVGAL